MAKRISERFRVKIDYKYFDFDDAEEAMIFAQTAKRHSSIEDGVTVEIEVLDEEVIEE